MEYADKQLFNSSCYKQKDAIVPLHLFTKTQAPQNIYLEYFQIDILY